MNSKSKVCVVTGGGSGIGRSICLSLAKLNHKVIVIDLTVEAATNTVDEIISSGGLAEAIELDVSNHSHAVKAFNHIKHNNGRIDVLINNAGVGSVGNLELTTEEELDRVYRVNVKGVYNCSFAVVPHMKERKNGLIINLASIASSVGIPDRFAYSMSKGAVLTMTYSIAKDYVNDGIRCNCIAPGRVHTPFVDDYLEKNYPDSKEQMFTTLSKTQPLGRMGTPEEIASLVNYLCSDSASFITGSNIPIDGGFVTINN